MQPFTIVEGIAAPLPGANIDTDVIMPKQFLKGVDRSGLADGVFHDLRRGRPAKDFVLNRDPWRQACFLVVGPNFGCGSSREHAVWGLAQLGIRALVGTSFAGIFFDNCARNGMLALVVEPAVSEVLLLLAATPDKATMEIDLPAQTIAAADGSRFPFDIDEDRKQALILGLDPIGTTLRDRDTIREFEGHHLAKNPWLA